MLQHILPNLTTLSKVFQTGSLNFSKIIPSLEKCKAKIQDIVEKDEVFKDLERNIDGRLSSLNIKLTQMQRARIQSLPKKYADSLFKNLEDRFPKTSCKILESFTIFDPDLLAQALPEELKVYGVGEIRLLAKHFFPNTEIELVKSQ